MKLAKNIVGLSAHALLVLAFVYSIAVAGYPILAGAWPSTVLFITIYIIVLSRNEMIGVPSQVALIFTTAILLIGMLFIGGANVSTHREILFEDGIPSVFGAISVIGLSCVVVFCALGFSGMGKQFAMMLDDN